MVDMRREREHIRRKGYDFAEAVNGEAVVWFEYDAVASTMHPVYDEPSLTRGRAWKPGVLVPVQWINETEDVRANEHDGRLPTNSIRFAVGLRTFRRCGVSAPEDDRRHLNDIIVYRRNYWRVVEYNRRGRLAGESMILSVLASQVRADDDEPYGDLPPLDGMGSTVRPRGDIVEGYSTQTFNSHEAPAYKNIQS